MIINCNDFDLFAWFCCMNSARLLALKQTEGRTILYTALGSEWRQFGAPRKRRPLESVVLDVGVGERILDDLVDFIGNPQWYSQRGLKDKTFSLDFNLYLQPVNRRRPIP